MPPLRSKYMTTQEHRSSPSSFFSSRWTFTFSNCLKSGRNSKRSYFVWLTILCYILGAFYAYTLYYDRSSSVSHNPGSEPRINNPFGSDEEKSFNSYFPIRKQETFKVQLFQCFMIYHLNHFESHSFPFVVYNFYILNEFNSLINFL